MHNRNPEILTFNYLIAILGDAGKNASVGFAGIPIGFVLSIIHMVGIPIIGTSVNPARSLGPAQVAGGTALSQLWVFITEPIIGAVIAATVWKYLFENTSIPA